MTTYYLGEELTLVDSEETIFTCVTAGKHSVYVNGDNQVWLIEPTIEIQGIKIIHAAASHTMKAI